MTQIAANFMLTPVEREVIKDALVKEYPLINDGEFLNPPARIYQALSNETGNLRFRWSAHEARNLLDRLLVACPEFAKSCGLYVEADSERYPSWSKLESSKVLIAACSQILEGLGYAVPR